MFLEPLHCPFLSCRINIKEIREERTNLDAICTDTKATRLSSNRLDLVAQLVKHWTGKRKVSASISTMHGQAIFQLTGCGHTRSNISKKICGVW